MAALGSFNERNRVFLETISKITSAVLRGNRPGETQSIDGLLIS
jgi:hypothetical protein